MSTNTSTACPSNSCANAPASSTNTTVRLGTNKDKWGLEQIEPSCTAPNNNNYILKYGSNQCIRSADNNLAVCLDSNKAHNVLIRKVQNQVDNNTECNRFQYVSVPSNFSKFDLVNTSDGVTNNYSCVFYPNSSLSGIPSDSNLTQYTNSNNTANNNLCKRNNITNNFGTGNAGCKAICVNTTTQNPSDKLIEVTVPNNPSSILSSASQMISLGRKIPIIS